MARFVINSKIFGVCSFFVPDNGGYVRLELDGKSGTLGRQICQGGGFMGNTLSGCPESLENIARLWHKARLRNCRN